MKKRNLLTLVLMLLLSCNVLAQDLVPVVDGRGKVGFADRSENIVIKQEYDSATPFKKGVSIVTKSGKSGMIDPTGKILVPIKYSMIQPWSETVYLVKDGKKYGLVSETGSMLLNTDYSLISALNCYGKAVIAQGGSIDTYKGNTYMSGAKYGIVNAEGRTLIPAQYKGLYEYTFECGSTTYPYCEGTRLAYSYHYLNDTLRTDCSYVGYSDNGTSIYDAGILDENGNIILKSGLYSFPMKPLNGMVRYYDAYKTSLKCGYYNIATGKAFEVVKYDKDIDNVKERTHTDFHGDLACVDGGKVWKVYDKDGNMISDAYNNFKWRDTHQMWAFKNATDKTWTVYGYDKQVIEKLSGYTDIVFPKFKEDKVAFGVEKDGKYGVITKSGDVVVPFQYDKLFTMERDEYSVRKNGKMGMITASNKVLIPLEYIEMIRPKNKGENDYWLQKTDSLWYHYSTATKKLGTKGFRNVTKFDRGLATVQTPRMNIPANSINNAQIYYPNASRKQITEANLSKYRKYYYMYYNNNDEMVFEMPVSTAYQETVTNEIRNRGNRVLTAAEQKDILLRATVTNRLYGFYDTIDEQDWNY